jgi:voltage-gated potassium channel
VISVVLETEPLIADGKEHIFLKLNYAFGSIFLIEYLARLYAIGTNSRYYGIRGRIKYIFSFYALIDLIAFLPFLIFPTLNESFLLRFFRIFRLFSLLKTSKHAKGLILIGQVVKDKMYELLYSITITLGVIFISAVLLYLAEGSIQPEQFGSIPRALWWATSTLTTISYGDVIPISITGKVLTMIITLASIGIVAIPTGILAAGFSEAISRQNYRYKVE